MSLTVKMFHKDELDVYYPIFTTGAEGEEHGVVYAATPTLTVKCFKATEPVFFETDAIGMASDPRGSFSLEKFVTTATVQIPISSRVIHRTTSLDEGTSFLVVSVERRKTSSLFWNTQDIAAKRD